MGNLLKGKILVPVIAKVVLVGGATTAIAATPAGQELVQSVTRTRPTVTQGTRHDGQNGTPTDQLACGEPCTCPNS